MSLVAVGRYLNAHEAHVVRSRLDAEGIFAVVVHEHHTHMDWRVALAIGGAKVLVHPDDMPVVRQVFQDSQSGALAKSLEAEFGDIDNSRCPVCGSARMTSRRSPVDVTIALVALFVFFIPIPVHAERHTCKACGARWRGRDENIRPANSTRLPGASSSPKSD